MKISVLGPLTIRSGGASLAVRAAKPKKVLALLLLRANTVVTMEELIEEVWDYEPPRSSVVTLQTYISQLRKALRAVQPGPGETAGDAVLTTASGGYVFTVCKDHLDLEVFKRLARAGARALEEGRNELAAGLLHDALDLWTGPPLVDVQHGPLLLRHVNHMQQCRLSVREQCVEADLRLGRHRALLGELTMLASEYPLNESVHAKLILALYRSGQRARALDVFQRLRQTLVDELGLEPAPEMQRLHQAVLAAQLPMEPQQSLELVPARSVAEVG